MYQYKGMLKSKNEIIAEGHSVQDVEHQVLHYRRQQKANKHTNMNIEVKIVHIKRDQSTGLHEEVLVKVI